MSKQIASNTFTEGLMKDTNLLTTPNNVLTDCLNGTTITYNGKEFVLQNDMGNAIVETASLKRGYIPIGLKEYNGIIYVVSLNPLENRVEFGSFPSPERNFTGEDLDTGDYELEGCQIDVSDFYINNPNFGNIIPSSSIVLNANSYPGTYIDKLPAGLGKEDEWQMNTQSGQPQFIINKDNISDNFESSNLQLNTGDRFVIYYTDLKQQDGADYIQDILKPYLSDSTTKRLFRLEVWAIGSDSKTLITDIDPLLYTKEDVTLGGLNGTLDESLNYNIFRGGSGTIEIRLYLEKPESFAVSFAQIAASELTVRFYNRLINTSFIQYKGFRYKFLHNAPNVTLTEGFMNYTLSSLYTSQGDYYKKNNSIEGVCLLKNLSEGIYFYEITPFTQYGYEETISGTFSVSATVFDPEVEITNLRWKANTGDFLLEFNSNLLLTDVNDQLNSIVVELYDVWSNCSHVLYNDTNPTTILNYNQALNFNNQERTKIRNNDTVYGVPRNLLRTTTISKLPKVLWSGDLTEFIDQGASTSLRKNHFYVLIVYYTYTNLDSTFIKAAHRYVYTNDEFNSAYNTLSDFSYLPYPKQTISISSLTTTPEINTTNDTNLIESSLLFDPLLQRYNQTKLFSSYAIGPTDYYNHIVTGKKALLTRENTHNLTINQVVTHIIPITAPGDLNTDIITLLPSSQYSIVLDTTNRASAVNGNAILSSLIFGELQNLNYTKVVTTTSEGITINYNFDAFKTITSKVHDYTHASVTTTRYLYPLFYQASREIQDKIVEGTIENSILSLSLLGSNLDCQPLGTNSLLINNTERVNLNNHLTTPVPTELYGVVYRDAFSNDSVERLDIFKSTGYIHSDFEASFLQATKRQNDTPAGLAVIELTYKYSNACSQRQTWGLIISRLEDTKVRMWCGFEVLNGKELTDLLLFFGAWTGDDYNPGYHQYEVSGSDYLYETNASTIEYVVDDSVTLYYDSNKPCYTVWFGAKALDKTLDENNILTYLNGLSGLRLAGYTSFMFPTVLENTKHTIINNETISIHPANDMNTITDDRLIVDNTEHPLMSIYTFTDFLSYRKQFMRTDYALSSNGVILKNLLFTANQNIFGDTDTETMFNLDYPTDLGERRFTLSAFYASGGGYPVLNLYSFL